MHNKPSVLVDHFIDRDLQAQASYSPHGGPSVHYSANNGVGFGSPSINVSIPSTGTDSLDPDEARRLADELENAPDDSVLASLYLGDADTERSIEALRAAADCVETQGNLNDEKLCQIREIVYHHLPDDAEVTPEHEYHDDGGDDDE